MKNKIKK